MSITCLERTWNMRASFKTWTCSEFYECRTALTCLRRGGANSVQNGCPCKKHSLEVSTKVGQYLDESNSQSLSCSFRF